MKRIYVGFISLVVTLFWVTASFATEQFRTLWRGQWVTYVEVGDYAVTEGDIIIGQKDEVRAWREAVERGQLQTETARKALTIGGAGSLWNLRDAGGVVLVPYTITTAKPNIDAAIVEVNRVLAGVIRWVPRTTEPDYVDFNLTTVDGGACYSFVGRSGGKQSISGDPECSVGTMVHEMGHAMGLWHVQQDADARNFVDIRLAKMEPGSRSNNQPIFGTRTFGGYDYESNMHYSRTGFSASHSDRVTLETKPAGITVGASPSYSASDLDALYRLYGRAPTRTTIHSNPSGLSVIVNGVSYTTPAEFNWPIGSTQRLWVDTSALQTQAGFSYAFGRWSHDPSAEPSSQLTWQVKPGDGSLGSPASSPSDTVISANFIRLVEVKPTAPTQAGGTSTVTPRRTPWPETSTLYPQFTTFDLTASPNPGFDHYFTWGGAFSASGGAAVVPRLSLMVGGGIASQDMGALFHSGPTIRVKVSGPGTEDGIGVKITPPVGTSGQSIAPRIQRNTQGNWKLEFVSPQFIGTSIKYTLDGYDGYDDPAATTVAMPASGARDITIRAKREVQPYRLVQPSCAGNVSLSNASTWVTTGSPMTVSLTGNGIGVFTGWSGTLSGTATSQTINIGSNVPEFIARYNTTSTPISISAIFPHVLGDSSAAATFRIRGDGFTAASKVFVANQLVSSTFVNATTIDVALNRSQFSVGRVPVFVRNDLTTSCVISSGSVALDVLPTGNSATVNMVEFYNAALDYYFFTGRPADQALLDAASGWQRTGTQMKFFTRNGGGLLPIERFFFSEVAKGGTRGSHFFTAIAAEQRLLTAANPTNAAVAKKPNLEGIEGYAVEPLADRSCPAQTIPVYRAFRGAPRYNDDGNHRFSTSLTQHQDMVNRLGWTDEGVVFCATS